MSSEFLSPETHFLIEPLFQKHFFFYETPIPESLKIIKNNFGISKNIGVQEKNVKVQ